MMYPRLLSALCVSVFISLGAADGDLDTAGFNTPNGYAIAPNNTINVPINTIGNAVAIDTTGSGTRYVAGQNGTQAVIIAYTSVGALQPAFNSGAPLVTDFGISAVTINGMTVQPDSNIVICGNRAAGTGFVARLTSAGVLDTTFNAPHGYVILPTSFDAAHDIVLDSLGDIIVAGNSTAGDVRVTEFTTTGLITNWDTTVTVATLGGTAAIRSVALDSTGRVVIGGGYNGDTQFLVGRLLSSGAVDGAFGGTPTSGFASTLISGSANGRAYGIAVYTTGPSQDYILTVGSVDGTVPALSAAFAQWTSAGTLDGTFGSGGTSNLASTFGGVSGTENSAAYSVVIDYVDVGGNDPFFYVTGFGQSGGNPPGVLYGQFISSNGSGWSTNSATIGGSASGVGNDMALAATGGPVVIGGFAPILVSGVNDIAAAQFHGVPTDVLLDPTFNPTGPIPGTIATDIGTAPSTDIGKDCALQSTGKIIEVGIGGGAGLIVRRWNTDGTLDTGFNSGSGIIYDTNMSGNGPRNRVAVNPDDSFLIVGSTGLNDAFVTKFLVDGAYDTSFNGTGLLTFNVGTTLSFGTSTDSAADIVIDGSGSIYIVGTTNATGNNHIFVAKITPTGSLDTFFNGSGITILASGSGTDTGTAITLQSGNIIAAGYDNVTTNQLVFARYNPSTGGLDTTFGSGTGVLRQSIPTVSPTLNAIALTASNGIVTAGTDNNSATLLMAAILADGSGLDTSFASPNGYVTSSIGSNATGNDILIQSNGNIVVTGIATIGSTPNVLVAKYLAGGQPNTVFGSPNGYVTNNITSGDTNQANGILITADEKLVVAGGTTNTPVNDFLIIQYLNSLLEPAPITVQRVFCGNTQVMFGVQNGKRILIQKIGNQVITKGMASVDVDQTFVSAITPAEVDALQSVCTD